MELLLWQWSTAVQVTSMVMIAVFFAALNRSVRRPETRLWARAFLVNLGALVLALGYWYFRPSSGYRPFFVLFYVGAKMTFLVLLVQGAWVLSGRDGWALRNSRVVPALVLFSVLTAFAVRGTDQLGFVSNPVMALVLLAGVLPLRAPISDGTFWLSVGFLARALLLLAEAGAYFIRLVPERFPHLLPQISLFISAASSFDSGAEWLMALGCVLALSNRVERELRESNAELIAARRIAEDASRAKSAFLSNMSHELRTPLNAVIGFSNLMARSPSLSVEDRESASIIRRSGEHLLGLINDVLSMSKIEAGKMVIERRPFDPRAMIAAVVGMVQGRAEDAGTELKVDLDPTLPRAVMGDEGRLRQALLNLLSNAVKFTRSGTVTLRARWEAGRGVLEVSDTGPGIAEVELPHLFEMFAQTESGRKTQDGTGLGLAITRELVRLMGGEISVASRVGAGTTFRFDVTLPRAEEPLLKAVGSRVVGFEAQAVPPRFLVVDDVAENRVLLRRLLESVGLKVDEASNGIDAVAAWRAFGHDLIFMDQRMPGMSGSAAAEAIRVLETKEARRRTAIVAVTASVFEHERDAILALGMDAVVIKPLTEEDVFEAISAHTGVRFIREPVVAPAHPARRRVLLVDDQEISRLVAAEVLRQLGIEVTEATGGASALRALDGCAADATFDAALLDLEMPEMDGRETLRAIRARERWRSLPVIVLTAHDLEEAQIEGMSGYLPKPVNVHEVRKALVPHVRLDP